MVIRTEVDSNSLNLALKIFFGVGFIVIELFTMIFTTAVVTRKNIHKFMQLWKNIYRHGNLIWAAFLLKIYQKFISHVCANLCRKKINRAEKFAAFYFQTWEIDFR